MQQSNSLSRALGAIWIIFKPNQAKQWRAHSQDQSSAPQTPVLNSALCMAPGTERTRGKGLKKELAFHKRGGRLTEQQQQICLFNEYSKKIQITDIKTKIIAISTTRNGTTAIIWAYSLQLYVHAYRLYGPTVALHSSIFLLNDLCHHTNTLYSVTGLVYTILPLSV